jgi:hypothetical protein
MASLIGEKVRLFGGGPVPEAVRQWIILIVLLFIFSMIAYSILQLVRTYRKCLTADITILSIIQIRIIFMLVFEFLYPNRFFLILSDIFHLIIFTIIFDNLIKRLLSTNNGLMGKYQIYVGLVSLAIIGLFILCLIKFKKIYGCDANSDYHNVVFVIIEASEMIMAFLILVLTCIITATLRRREKLEDNLDQNSFLKDILDQKEQMRIKKHQINILAVGLFIYAILFVTLAIIAEVKVYEEENNFE